MPIKHGICRYSLQNLLEYSKHTYDDEIWRSRTKFEEKNWTGVKKSKKLVVTPGFHENMRRRQNQIFSLYNPIHNSLKVKCVKFYSHRAISMCFIAI